MRPTFWHLYLPLVVVAFAVVIAGIIAKIVQ